MWSIGPYRLDATTFSLERDGKPVTLQRRPLDLLLYLIARPRQVVSREELQDVVWSGVAVSPGALSTAVYEARAALGDLERPTGERWIETIRGRGFRFSGPAERVADGRPAEDLPLFVGRIELEKSLAQDLRRLESGHGGMRVIEGVAGMGKTRLVQEVTRDPGPAAVQTVFCERDGPPYWPWLQLVRLLSKRHLETHADDPDWLLETQADDLGSRFHFERLERMRHLLSKASELVPLVVVIEDIHWSDVPSLELLESLARHLTSMPVLFLVTHRVGEGAGDSIRAWTRSPHIGRDRLEPLPAAELYRLVAALTGRIPSPEFVGWVHKHSAGVPLMVRELAESADDSEELLPDVPQLAQLLLARRFDAIGREGRLALAVAALCGERFDVPLVEAAAGEELDDTRSWVREGVDSGILVADPRQPLRYAFRHSLLRDAARGGLTSEQAAEWHGRLARVLEELHPDLHRAAVAQLAHHSAAAVLIEGDLERPLRYALLAARNAGEVFAWEDVRVHSEHALGWIQFMSPDAERDAREVEAALLRCAGITPYSGHVEETDALLKRIDPILARSSHSGARALAEAFRFANARSLGDFDAASRCADVVSEIDGLASVAACWRLGISSLRGDFAAATASPDDEDLRGDDAAFIDFARLCGRDPEVDRLGLTAFASWGLGRDKDALERAERAVRWADDRGDSRSKIWAIFMLCMLHDLRRDWASLEELAPVLEEQTTRHGITPWLGAGMALSLWAAARQRESPLFPGSQFGAIMRERGHASNVSLRTMLLLLSSRIFTVSGDLAEAEGAAQDGLGYCERTGERHMASELGRQLARVLEARGGAAPAQEARQRALAIARDQGNVVSEVRILADQVEAGQAAKADHTRLRVLRKRLGPRFGPHEQALLERALVGPLPGADS